MALIRWGNFNHRKAIADFINEANVETFVEIGVDLGELGHIVQRNCSGIRRYYMIDPWRPYWGEGAGKFAKLNKSQMDLRYTKVYNRFATDSRFKILRKTSMNCVFSFPNNSVDVVYIDGVADFTHVTRDIGLWESKPRIALMGDNYSIKPAVKMAVDSAFSNVETIARGRVWLVRKV